MIGDNIRDVLVFQIPRYFLAIEATVHANKANFLVVPFQPLSRNARKLVETPILP